MSAREARDSIFPIRSLWLEPREALENYPLVVPERTTFYGARELIVRDPAGNGVCFGAH